MGIAIITGLVSRPDLNGKEVTLIDFDEDNERWSVNFVGEENAGELRLRPPNLLLSLLQKEAERAQKKEEEDALKQKYRDEQRAIRETAREAQNAQKAAEKEAERATK